MEFSSVCLQIWHGILPIVQNWVLCSNLCCVFKKNFCDIVKREKSTIFAKYVSVIKYFQMLEILLLHLTFDGSSKKKFFFLIYNN